MLEGVFQGQSQSIAAAALAAARAAASGTGHGQVSVLETRRFAGKDIQARIHHAGHSACTHQACKQCVIFLMNLWAVPCMSYQHHVPRHSLTSDIDAGFSTTLHTMAHAQYMLLLPSAVVVLLLWWLPCIAVWTSL